ncbi:MAG: hypothetical protein K6E68_00335 [Lachnospiraceae bacterium]|nr:hypothetical protein [Lachnospiraceae bacterium]
MDENKNMTNELNEALKGMWENLSDEQKEKAKECRTMDELMLLAGRHGIELPDEVLDAVAGGLIRSFQEGVYVYCPFCGTEVEFYKRKDNPEFHDNIAKHCGQCFRYTGGKYYDMDGKEINTSVKNCS